jgi:hypothetical protein
MRLPYLIIFLILFTSSYSCKKQNERTCIKGSGNKTSKVIDLNPISFKGISIFNNLNINLIPDSINYASISSFKNTIDLISFEVVDSLLEIRDGNKCNFLRDFEKQTTIDFHYKKITVLSLNGNGNINTLAPIENDVVHVYSLSSNSNIDIEVKALSFVAKLVNGTLSGTISGSGKNSNIFHSGHSNINFEELEVENLRFTNKSDADLYIKSTTSLFAELLSIGNIYYKGNPSIEVTKNRFGSKIVNNN